MSLAVRRGIAAAGTVALGAAVNVATGMLTQHWAWAWWAGTIALVVVGAALQVWLTLTDRDEPGESAASTRSVTVNGDVSGIVSTGDNSINIQNR